MAAVSFLLISTCCLCRKPVAERVARMLRRREREFK